jgi:hypothetical protein
MHENARDGTFQERIPLHSRAFPVKIRKYARLPPHFFLDKRAGIRFPTGNWTADK